MKQQRSALFQRVDGYVRSVRSQGMSLGGVPCSTINKEIFLRCLKAWLFLTEDVMIRSRLTIQSREDRMQNFISALVQTDLVALFSLFREISRVVIDSTQDSTAFKQQLSLVLGSTDRRLVSPISSALFSLVEKSDRERPYVMADVLQFLRFPLKLNFQDIGLEKQALEDYNEIEDQLATVECECSEFLNEVRDIITQWFRDFQIELLKPVHGPGSVAEGPLTQSEKYKNLSTDTLVRIALNNCNPRDYLGYYPRPPSDGIVRISRTIFVPKTVSKLRTISMEPVSLQYLQQGVMWEIYRYIDRHPYLGARMRLDDQRQNQVLALEGSKYGNFCTIDLSHASDSVSWSLVKAAFKGVPRLYKWLLITRSRATILPDGTLRQLKKFAPMGSALCFPIESILFAACVECASRRHDRHFKIEKGFSNLYSVYGDDLVVHRRIYSDVVRVLESFGFSVNKEKSFATGKFRESCGKDYYDGVEISSLYHRLPYYRDRLSPSALGNLCSAANNSSLHKLPMYRLHLLREIFSEFRHPPYFGYDDECSPIIFSPTPTNYRCDKRWNKDYQRWEGRFVSVATRQRSEEFDDDDLRYFRRLVDMARYPGRGDESSSSFALHGCISFFRLVRRPIVPYLTHRLDKTHDLDGT